MLFQKKIDRAYEKLHEESDHPEEDHFSRKRKEQEEMEDDVPELEKNDFLAMVISAFIVIVPVAVLVLGGLSLIGYFFLMH